MIAGPAAPGPGDPHPALNALNRLVGTWAVTGPDLAGSVRCDWMDGGYFLVAHLRLTRRDRHVTAVEYIGHDPARDALTSYYLDSTGATDQRHYLFDAHTVTITSDPPGRTRVDATFDGDTGCTTRWESPTGTDTAIWRRVP